MLCEEPADKFGLNLLTRLFVQAKNIQTPRQEKYMIHKKRSYKI